MKYNNIILTIVPEDIDGKCEGFDDKDCLRASFCYLHGELEQKNGFDIFSLLKSEVLPEHQDLSWISNDFPSGEYECICFDQPCTFFIWKRSSHCGGLVVFNADRELYKDAKEKYQNKAICI